MHRAGSDPMNMQPNDFICDFCHTPWDGTFPMVEGHKGSLICGRCLTVAYAEAGFPGSNTHNPQSARKCTMCLADKSSPGWQSPLHEAWTCVTCIKHASGKLHKDPDWPWRKPAASTALKEAEASDDD